MTRVRFLRSHVIKGKRHNVGDTLDMAEGVAMVMTQMGIVEIPGESHEGQRLVERRDGVPSTWMKEPPR